MNQFQAFLEGIDQPTPEFSLEALATSMLLAFVLGQVVAWTYMRTHTGLSYSRGFTQSLVLMMLVVSMVMHTIGNSIVMAFGLIGALALIRFRNVLKDTRDTVFVFFVLVLGMACGSGRYATAVFGTVTASMIAFYLAATGFGSRGTWDGHLTCRLEGGEETRRRFRETVRRFCRGLKEISARHSPGGSEFVYQVRLRDRQRGEELTRELLAVPGVGDVALVLRDELTEV